MDNNLIIVFILVFSIILILGCLICYKKEKFNQKVELRSPVILTVTKKKTDGILEWYNDDKRVKEFIVLYLDVFSDLEGVWVQRSIRCDKKKCRLILRNLLGSRYKLTVLSVLGDNISDIEDIVDFSDNNDFNNTHVIEAPSEYAVGTDNVILKYNEQDTKKSETPAPSEKNISNNKKNNKSTPPPSYSKKPKIVCDPKVVRHNIKTKEQLESAEVDYKCEDNRDIGMLKAYIEEKPFYHNTWEKIFE